MKSILVTLSLLVALFQVSSCYPSKLLSQIESTAEQCYVTSNANDDFGEQVGEGVIPEGNQVAKDFFGCFSLTLKLQDKKGDFDLEKLSLVIREIAKIGMRVSDDYNETRYVADAAVEHCKSTPKTEDYKLNAVKMYNCFVKYFDE